MGQVEIVGPHGRLPGYGAIPPGHGVVPGVIVLPEVYGLNDDIRAHTDRLATEGYVAFAPDLYSYGPKARCIAATMAALARGHGRAFDEIEAARTYVADHERCNGRVGVIGFCMGGGFAIALAPMGGFQAAAPNYGQVPRDAATRLADACPVVGSYGAKDWMMPKHAARLEKALIANGIAHDVKEYPDTSHSFLNRHEGVPATFDRILRMGYRPAAADDAWERILAFFSFHLGGATEPQIRPPTVM
jgi:carboxymethylenebutenolidase